MKRVLIVLISLLIIVFIIISFVVKNDNKYIEELEDIIIRNTDIEKMEYVNYYDNYYMVIDDNYLYLFDNEFDLIFSVDENMLFDKYYKYDIVYRDKTLMLMDNYKNKEGIIFKYYDIYTGECIDEIIIN